MGDRSRGLGRLFETIDLRTPANGAERSSRKRAEAKARRHRLVFLLRDVEGLSIKEAADALGLGFAAYASRLIWMLNAPAPTIYIVLSTVAHVAGGAIVLATTAVLAIQTRRMIRAGGREAGSAGRRIARSGVVAPAAAE